MTATPIHAHHDRIERLLAEMTLEEKAGQLTQYFYFADINQGGTEPAGIDFAPAGLAEQPRMVEAKLAAGVVGSLLFVRRASEINRLQRLVIAGNRLGIPALFGFDVIHGLRTIMPVPIAMAASWDPAIIERGQAVAAREARAVGIHWTFAPMCDVTRDPRWGRIIEGAGEDPVLGAAVAVAQVRGFQGDGPAIASDRVLAGPKHFAGYGFAVGGRDYDEVDISEASMWNTVLPPFRAAIEAGARNVMTAYMDRNGIPSTGDEWLLRDVLRTTWGFDGFVVSDAQAVHSLCTHGFAADLEDAAARGITAGCDLEMAIADPAYAHLPAAVAAGSARIEDIDDSVRRVLQAKAEAGLFDDPYIDEAHAAAVLADPAHREIAREAAERTFVLLRNEGQLLPLDPSGTSSLAVIGPLADSQRDTLGPWIFDFELSETVTILDGIRRRLGNVPVEFAPGVRPGRRTFPSMFDIWPGNSPADPVDFDDDAELQRAVALAARSSVAIVVIGEWQHMVGEGASRSSLELPGNQLQLLQAVVATGTPVVAVVMNGRPLDLQWAAANVPAILDVWYPGTSGGSAVAAALFGDVSPAGKLPFTWPRSVGQVPIFYNHTTSHDPGNQHRRYWDEDGHPLFPFGFGLSYSSFEYGTVSLDRAELSRDDVVTVSVDVTNVGGRDADEVVQLYVHQASGTASRPVRELKGFRRIALRAGETVSVEFVLGREQLSYWNAAARDWVFDAADYLVGVGGDSTVALTQRFAVTPK